MRLFIWIKINERANRKMNRQALFYPLICILINLILGIILSYYGRICITNFDAMGVALSGLTVWALRFPYIFFLLAAMGTALMFPPMSKKITDKRLFGLCFGILVIDIGLLLVSTLGYSIPFLQFPVTID